MIGGVSFQPGSLDQVEPRKPAASGSQGVQEAIKVLSLRLPKVVGAQAVAPSALLTSQGSGGNPHIDSLVESVMAKMFPGAGAQPTQAPMAQPPQQPQPPQSQPEGPHFTGSVEPSAPPKKDPEPNFWTTFPKTPTIIVEKPNWTGDFVGSVGDFTMPGSPGYQGGPQQPSMIAPAPDLRKYLDWVPQGPGHDEVPMI